MLSLPNPPSKSRLFVFVDIGLAENSTWSACVEGLSKLRRTSASVSGSQSKVRKCLGSALKVWERIAGLDPAKREGKPHSGAAHIFIHKWATEHDPAIRAHENRRPAGP